jgi:hypothetical protein
MEGQRDAGWCLSIASMVGSNECKPIVVIRLTRHKQYLQGTGI